jgi:hypothetical protein
MCGKDVQCVVKMSNMCVVKMPNVQCVCGKDAQCQMCVW